jgi:pyrimidine operon attenuation protein/uracil phosphoribosyltransferase
LKNEYKPEIIRLFRYYFFRDDFRRTDKPLEANETKINFIVENKKVIFIDDVFLLEKYSICLDCYSIFGRPQN